MTKIEWTDATWNPTTGCTRASAGCDNCYAFTMTKRLAAMGQEKYQGLTGNGHFNGVLKTHDDDLAKPLRWKKPRMVFVNSMSDLFHKDVPFEFIDKVFGVMALTPQHTYQVLTKRPERMAEFLNRSDRMDIWESVFSEAFSKHIYQNPKIGSKRYSDICGDVGYLSGTLPNVWLGTSCEDQQRADERIPWLLKCPAAVRFLSCEPLLGPVNLRAWTDKCSYYCDHGEQYPDGHRPEASQIHWVIVGGESGPHARPMHRQWARSIQEQCSAAGVAFFFKQWGEWMPSEREEPGCICVDYAGRVATEPQHHGYCAMKRVGKKNAGRLLDGREWNEFPNTTEEACR